MLGSFWRASRLGLALVVTGVGCAVVGAVGATAPLSNARAFAASTPNGLPLTSVGDLQLRSPIERATGTRPAELARQHLSRQRREVRRSPAAPATVGVVDRRPISPGLLIALIRACAPTVNPVTQAAVISVESSGDAWALHDDNDGREYRPRSLREAVALARQLIATNRVRYGRSDAGVDVGVGQINSNNFASLGVDAGWMLHPCPNLRVSSTMIASAYRAQYELLDGLPGPARDQLAIRRALQVYNSGHATGDDAYVENVVRALQSGFVVRIARATIGAATTDAVDAPRARPERPDQPDSGSTGLFIHEDPGFNSDHQGAARGSASGAGASIPTTQAPEPQMPAVGDHR